MLATRVLRAFTSDFQRHQQVADRVVRLSDRLAVNDSARETVGTGPRRQKQSPALCSAQLQTHFAAVIGGREY